jgi:hypothetical protein
VGVLLDQVVGVLLDQLVEVHQQVLQGEVCSGFASSSSEWRNVSEKLGEGYGFPERVHWQG